MEPNHSQVKSRQYLHRLWRQADLETAALGGRRYQHRSEGRQRPRRRRISITSPRAQDAPNTVRGVTTIATLSKYIPTRRVLALHGQALKRYFDSVLTRTNARSVICHAPWKQPTRNASHGGEWIGSISESAHFGQRGRASSAPASWTTRVCGGQLPPTINNPRSHGCWVYRVGPNSCGEH